MQALTVEQSKNNAYTYEVTKALNTLKLDSITIQAQAAVYFVYVYVFSKLVPVTLGPYSKEQDVNILKPEKKIVIIPAKKKKKRNCCTIM